MVSPKAQNIFCFISLSQSETPYLFLKAAKFHATYRFTSALIFSHNFLVLPEPPVAWWTSSWRENIKPGLKGREHRISVSISIISSEALSVCSSYSRSPICCSACTQRDRLTLELQLTALECPASQSMWCYSCCCLGQILLTVYPNFILPLSPVKCPFLLPECVLQVTLQLNSQ